MQVYWCIALSKQPLHLAHSLNFHLINVTIPLIGTVLASLHTTLPLPAMIFSSAIVFSLLALTGYTETIPMNHYISLSVYTVTWRKTSVGLQELCVWGTWILPMQPTAALRLWHCTMHRERNCVGQQILTIPSVTLLQSTLIIFRITLYVEKQLAIDIMHHMHSTLVPVVDTTPLMMPTSVGYQLPTRIKVSVSTSGAMLQGIVSLVPKHVTAHVQ